jgi:hypothetical protein
VPIIFSGMVSMAGVTTNSGIITVVKTTHHKGG